MNILITGASGNLGKAAVEKFVADGYTIFTTVSPGKSLGFPIPDQVHVYEVDLTHEKNAQDVIDKIISDHQLIDAALLLAGAYAGGNISKTDGSALRKMFAVNFETAFYVARPLFQQMQMQENGGRIVFVGSRPSLRAREGKNALAYALSKSLIVKLAELLNAEGADKNVISSVIIPSTIDTPANRAAMPNANFSDWVKPEEIVEAMLYLVSEKGRALRDTVLKIYGRV